MRRKASRLPISATMSTKCQDWSVSFCEVAPLFRQVVKVYFTPILRKNTDHDYETTIRGRLQGASGAGAVLDWYATLSSRYVRAYGLLRVGLNIALGRKEILMLPGPWTTLVMVVALLGAAVPQPATAAIEPSPSPQTAGKGFVLTVPEGGTVRSLSNNHMCGAGDTCEIPIDDEFHEVFIPQPKVGYRFNSWKQSSEHFCGGQIVNCTITTDTANSATRLEPIFDRDVSSTGYKGIRKLDYSDMDVGGLFFNQVHADFDGDGVLDLFRVAGDASGRSTERKHLEMWIGKGDGTYRRDDGMLVDPTAGGINPRKVVAADFNGDNKQT